jgi:serine/threonine-protein kinase
VSAPPASVGPYTIDREIGRGGMGVVYLGHDGRLDRAVAIKALPDHLADDPARLARFEREARTLAQLNHPNVAGIYGVEEQDGHKYLILEYVEGETLADVLDRGAVPVEDALELAIEIAAGLEAAHEAGVVHRDLKPANVKITPDGKMKVLDFGLARVEDTSASGISESPTLTSPVRHSPTIPGAIMGTAPYMSPEQARGRRVDKRTDIWSFGVVLYEMLTGIGPFHGETATDSIGAILHKDVDLGVLPAGTPASARRVIGRCLERDKASRFRDIGDVRYELERSDSDGGPGAGGAPSRRVVALLVVLALVIGAAAAWLARPVPVAAPAATARLSLPLPWARDRVEEFGISADGDRLAFAVLDEGEQEPTWSVHIRDLDSLDFDRVHSLRHRPRFILFTPDGRELMIGVSHENDRDMILRIPVDGGRPVPLLDAHTDDYTIGRAMWLDDEEILLQGEDDERKFFAVSSRDGSVRPLATLPERSGPLPNPACVVPGGRHLVANGVEINAGEFVATTVAIDLTSGTIHSIAEDFHTLHVSEDLIVLRRNDEYFAVPFDAKSARTTGELRPIPDVIDDGVVAGRAGHFAYFPEIEERGRLATIDRSGEIASISDARRRHIGTFVVSPDGAWISTRYGDEPDRATLAAVEVATGRPQRMDAGLHVALGWIDDGRFAYLRPSDDLTFDRREVEYDLLTWHPIRENEELALRAGTTSHLGHVALSPDGAYVVQRRRHFDGERPPELGPRDRDWLEIIDLADTASGPAHFLNLGMWHARPRFSPDGRWLAVGSGATGRSEIYAVPFDPAGPGSTVRVSLDGGWQPMWSHDSRELFWTGPAPGGAGAVLMSAEMTGDDPLAFSAPKMLLEEAEYDGSDLAPMPDGDRFVFEDKPDPRPEDEHLVVVVSWEAEIRRRLASEGR